MRAARVGLRGRWWGGASTTALPGTPLTRQQANLLAGVLYRNYQQGTILRGNVITGNKNPRAPAIEEGFSGGGIGIAGGRDNVISGNRITGNGDVGVLILNQQGYRPTANRFTGNTITGQQVDVVVTGRSAGCFSGNRIGTSNPAGIEQVAPCTGAPTSTAARTPWSPAPAAPEIDYRKIPLPPPQPGMPTP